MDVRALKEQMRREQAMRAAYHPDRDLPPPFGEAPPPTAAPPAPAPRVNPFHEEYDTVSAAANLPSFGELASSVGQVVGDSWQARTKELADAEKAKQMVEAGKSAAERARGAAERAFGAAASAVRPAVEAVGTTLDRGARKRQVAEQQQRRHVKVGPFTEDWGSNRDPDDPELHGLQAFPGEEQQSTAQTLAMLPPDVSASLRGKWEAGGHSETMPFDDWLSENFSDLPPSERAKAMRTVASQAVRIQAGQDPTLLPGQMSRLARERRAADKPLPEGRPLSHYSPEQRTQMQRNVFAPELPMQPFGGTATVTPSGATSMRAPNPEALQLAAQIAADPAQGEGSVSHLMALADAYGLDSARYGDDVDMLRSDVARMQKVHAGLAERYDTQPTGMGGYRYVPNEATKAKQAKQDALRLSRSLLQMYAGHPSFDGNYVRDMGMRGDTEALKAYSQNMRGVALEDRRKAARDREATYGLTRDLRSPNYAPGMHVRNLMQQMQAGNPLGMAAASQIAGDGDMARTYTAADVARRQTDASAEMARMEQERAQEEAARANMTPADKARQFMETLAAQPDPATRMEMAMTHVSAMQNEMGQADPAAAQRQARLLVAQTELREAAGDPVAVRRVFSQFAQDRGAFFALAANSGLSPDDANDLWNEIHGSAGARLGRAVGGIPAAVGGFLRDFANPQGAQAGQGDPAPPKPTSGKRAHNPRSQ